MIFDYILFCPAFVSNSAGIRAMHYLAAILSKAGLTVGSNGPNPYDDSVRIVTNTEFLGHPIAIYPDCVGPNNPLNLKRIVRFMCAPASWTPIGFFGGHRIPHSDCVFIFDPWLRDDVQEHYDGTLSPDCLLPIPCIEPNLFYAEDKTLEKVVYVGKGPYGGASANAIITRTSHARGMPQRCYERLNGFTPSLITRLWRMRLRCAGARHSNWSRTAPRILTTRMPRNNTSCAPIKTLRLLMRSTTSPTAFSAKPKAYQIVRNPRFNPCSRVVRKFWVRFS